MRFWTREVAGWLLVLIGLYVFSQCYRLLTNENHQILEGGSLTLVGIVVFRGGIHLLKIATAAQVCLEAQQEIEPIPLKNPAPAVGRAAGPGLVGRRTR
jgi:hypothetical protein